MQESHRSGRESGPVDGVVVDRMQEGIGGANQPVTGVCVDPQKAGRTPLIAMKG